MPLAEPPGTSSAIQNGHTDGTPLLKDSAESLNDSLNNGHPTSTPRPELKRKVSSPLMPAFMVSAPGKVIVYGEHAVVHGKVRNAHE